ncbi:hypothetical protein [Methanobrevibacter arboriphilus]|uniref:hypothetical protein n=1 Tax=Methanobrevibacter arboriphilus TaxID=39441 RepID=UPI0006D17312|nr:hypothetical protein [Methanobrevibacter arboriphilus]
MGIKELREQFHEQDAKVSEKFHKNEGGLKKLHGGKILITWFLVLVIASLVFGIVFGGLGSTNNTEYFNSGESSGYGEFSNVPLKPTLSEAEYKDICESISFKKLDKNPDAMIGKNVTYTGKVVQIMETGGITEIRLATDGSYNDIVYVNYDGTVDVYEGDTITIWGGEVLGSYSYTSQANYQITLPEIQAWYIE